MGAVIVSLLTSCWSTAGVQPCNDPRVWYEPVPDGDVAWGCLPPAGWLEAPPLAGGEDLELYEPPPGPTGLPLLDTGSFTPSLASPPLPSADTVDTGWWWTTAVTGATADTAPLDTAPLDTFPTGDTFPMADTFPTGDTFPLSDTLPTGETGLWPPIDSLITGDTAGEP